ncbi:hypothetical protein [Asticcacaulis endophyticus]|uniref:Uncharacterized protein n=1 Tax=Asticcacaulis endophyticus TaxID=1395890 RepID=A0A918QC14_9CAUL|nr:hypothetical protein [Asticcacaulis endophyticus]GGZ41461.1 hypothetical protein GCM10011273_30100 [Asticcacaulis endophyticus]
MKSGKISALGIVAVLAGFAFVIGSRRVGEADLRWMRWEAPPEASLTVAQGYFYPQAHDLQCKPPGCRQAELLFKPDGGEAIELNCEPFPAINTCLYDREGTGDNLWIAGKTVEIKYYDRWPGQRTDEYMLMAISQNGKAVMRYDDRVASVRSTATNERIRGGRRSGDLYFYRWVGRSFYFQLTIWGGIVGAGASAALLIRHIIRVRRRRSEI